MLTAEPISLALPDPWPSRVRGGIPFVDLSELPVAVEGAEPADVLALRASNYDPVGLGVFDPESGKIWSMPAAPEETLDEKFWHRRVHHALELRGRMGLTGDETAYRLINGEGDGLPGFLVDVYSRHVVVYSLSSALDRHAPALSKVIAAELHPHSVISKIRPAGEQVTGKIPFRVEHGEEPPANVVVRESEVAYEVHLTGGLNTGLFADMRNVRQSLRPWFRGKHVLNTFCYTGSFSVVAALEEAKSVTSVDFSAGVLDWAKKNFELNQLKSNDKRFKFVRDDVFEFIRVTKRHEKSFDVVILDPPAMTTVPGKRWFLKSDYGRLIAHALKIVSPGGLIVVATTCTASRPEKLETQIREAARETGRRLRLAESIGLPADFPTQMIYPQARHLKCFLLIAD